MNYINCEDAKKLKQLRMEIVDFFKEEGKTATFIRIKCPTCGNLQEEVVHKPILYGKYPQLNGSTGEVFNSWSEEKAFAKKHKLEGLTSREKVNKA